MNMKLHRLIRLTAAAISLGVIATVTLVPLAARDGRGRQLRIVKDCSKWSGVPGETYCEIKSSNVPELPARTKIYYNQITGGPSAGAKGFLDSTVFLYFGPNQWAVGRCTVPNDDGPGICSITEGFGRLAGFSADINVRSMGNYLYSWDGTYDRD